MEVAPLIDGAEVPNLKNLFLRFVEELIFVFNSKIGLQWIVYFGI